MKNENIKNLIRIAHYNILSGGKDRLNKIIKVIGSINPDICGLLEAVGWENNIDTYKKKFKSKGYKYFYLAKANSKYNIAIISKIQIKVEEVKRGIRHVIVKVMIKEGHLKNTEIYYVHLSPYSEDERISEIKILFKKISKSKNVILMGDFNALSFLDKNNSKKLLSKFKKKNITKYGTKNLRFDVISEIYKNNFIDTFNFLKNKFDYSTPTKCNTDTNHAEKIRIDYAFVNKNLLTKIKTCKIFKNIITETASDHYPLYIEIKN